MAASRPRPAHRLPGGRPFRRTFTAVTGADQGGSGGSAASQYILKGDGGKLLLGDGSGALLKGEST